MKKDKFYLSDKKKGEHEDHTIETLINKNDKVYSDLTWNFGFKTVYLRNKDNQDQIY